jgi:hypothetical protein
LRREADGSNLSDAETRAHPRHRHRENPAQRQPKYSDLVRTTTLKRRKSGDRVRVRRIQQGWPVVSANLDGMIAGNFEGVDLTVPIIAAAVTAAFFIGGFGRALWSIGRSRRLRAVTRWQRTLDAGLRHTGQFAMAAAAVILVGGTSIGLQQKSVDQINREEATARCGETYDLQFLDWLKTAPSPDLWWDSGPAMRHRTPGPAMKKEFVERRVLVSRD